MKILRVTKQTVIDNPWAIFTWKENVTFVYLTFLDIRIKTIYKYFISYTGELTHLI